MAANPQTFPTRTAVPPPTAPRHWERANLFMSVALVVALLVGIGAGSWYLSSQNAGNPDTPPAGMSELDQSSDATPDQTPALSLASGPFDSTSGIQSAVQRDYLRHNQQPDRTEVVAISIAAYRFDTLVNAYQALDLLIRDQVTSFTMQDEMKASTVISETLDHPGDRALQMQIVGRSGAMYEAQQYVFVLDQTRVFAVTMVTRGTTELTPEIVDNSQAVATDLATTLVERGNPPMGDAQFNQDGASTGGDWALMPETGDPLLLGLVASGDKQLLPPESGIVEAQPTYPAGPQDLTGILGVVSRTYASPSLVPTTDRGDPASATPMSDAYATTMGARRIVVAVYELDSPQDAAVAYNQIAPDLVRSLSQMSPGGKQVLNLHDTPDLGDQATNARLSMTFDDGESARRTTYQQIAVQRGEYVIFIGSVSEVGPMDELPAEPDDFDPLLDLANQIAAEGQPSAEEAIFAEDGTSTGGLWGFMPVSGDPLLIGLVPLMDQILYPVQTP